MVIRNRVCVVILLLVSNITVQGDEKRNLYHYMVARYEQAKSCKKALGHYKHLFDAQKPPVHAYSGYLQCLATLKKFDTILEHVPTLDQIFPYDPKIQMCIIKALESTGSHEQALDRLMRVAHAVTDNQEIALCAAHAYLSQQEPDNALAVVDSFLAKTQPKPNLCLVYFFKAHILVELNKKEQALDALKNSLTMHSHFDMAWLWRGMLEEQLGNIPASIKSYAVYLDLSGYNPSVERHLHELAARFIHKVYFNVTLAMPYETIIEAAAQNFQKKYDNTVRIVKNLSYLQQAVPKWRRALATSCLCDIFINQYKRFFDTTLEHT